MVRSLAEWLSYQETLHPSSIDLGLERVRAVAERLALLPLTGKTAIVGGTNGKGSTATMLAALASAHGMRVGLFTSPHLLRYQERVSVEGREASEPELIAAFERIEAARGAQSLTFFEFNTLAALWIFRARGVNCTVLEVGLGGRLDATNLVAADVAVLCSVGLDHRDWLGDTLESIGREKAGIFRRHQQVVLGSPALPATVWATLRDLACQIQIAEVDFQWHIHADGRWNFNRRHALIDSPRSLDQLPAPGMTGLIQYRNAASAIAALGALLGSAKVEAAAVGRALEGVQLVGRHQFVGVDVQWVFDVAHNEPAAAVLAEELRRRPVHGQTIAVFGMLGDKDVAAVTACLGTLVDRWLVCTLTGPRALSGPELVQRMGALEAPLEQCGAVGAAVARAASLAQSGDRILVCGSFHVVGPALQARGLY